MASGRILKGRETKDGVHHGGGFYPTISKSYLLWLVVMGLIMAGCGTAENIQKESLPEPPEETEQGPELSEEFIDTLNETRSELDDAYVADNEVPEFLLQPAGPERDIGDPYAGYRIQIISTRSVAKADSVAKKFRYWADQHITGYFPQTYVIFDQPYYKVHIGNFQFQQRAAKFTQMIKTKYPGAWVVHDRIDPEAVPEQRIRVVDE